MLMINGQPLTNKRTSEFLASKTLREKFGGLNIMKSVLSLDETPSALDRSVKAAIKLSRGSPTDLEMESIPLKDLSSLTEEIHVKTREVSQNTDLDMREFLGIDKALQNIQGELLNNTAKLKEIDKRIERDTKKLKEVENDSTYNDEQKQLYRDRLDDLRTEKQARLEILSQNRKDLQTQVGRIKQTLEKVLDKDAPLLERIRTLFRGTRHNYIFSIDCLLNDHCNNSPCHHGCFWRRQRRGRRYSIRQGNPEKMVRQVGGCS